MNFRKVLSSVIFLILIFSLTIPAFAEETNTHELIYQNNASYEISIPASSNIDIVTGKGSINIGVTETKLEKWTGVSIIISSTNYTDDTWNLVNTKDGADTIAYSIGTTDGANDVTSGDEITFVKEAGTTTLYVTINDTNKVGTFTDTITFTSEITEKEISFTIYGDCIEVENHVFYALDGMTWYDWVNSEYNTIGAIIRDDIPECPAGYYLLDSTRFEYETIDTLIQMDNNYYFGIARV